MGAAMNKCEIIVGDAVEKLREIPDGSVRTVVTSPPYWGLRDYGNQAQIGLEDTADEFIEKLCQVFDEVRRVLADDGTIWVNLGDTYVSKQLMGVPWRFAFAMQSRGWYLRQDIIWSKRNPLPESIKDRCTKSHEYIFLMSKKPRYYFDSTAIQEPLAESSMKRLAQNVGEQKGSTRAHGGVGHTMRAVASKRAVTRGGFGRADIPGQSDHGGPSDDETLVELVRNKRSVWNVSVARFKDAHFATYPVELVRPCILAGSEPGDTVLDPFSGAGTTGVEALSLGRDYIGVELNPEYARLSAERIEKSGGMFVSIDLR
jgi:DNA modification methylase